MAVRTVSVLDLRLKGLSLRAIAAQLGVSHEQVRVDEQAALAELAEREKTLAMQRRMVEGQRLDALQAAIWDKAQKGDIGAINTSLRISAQRAQLFGLNAPTRVTMTPATRPFHEMTEADLQQELAASLVSLKDTGLLPASVKVH